MLIALYACPVYTDLTDELMKAGEALLAGVEAVLDLEKV